MKPILFSRKFVRRLGTALLGLVLVASFFLAGQAPPAQASLYWASANGVANLSSGVRSSTPSLCFVGNAVSTRLGRVSQIIQYLQQYENNANITFVSAKSGLSLDSELAAGHYDQLTCPSPTISNGKEVYAGDIRMVIPNTSVNATTPVPGLGCMTDKLKSPPACVARDYNHVDCYARGVDDSTWDKHWDSTNGWGDWRQTLGGTTNAGPAVATISGSDLQVVARGVGDSALYLNSWSTTSDWSGWLLIPGTSGQTAVAPPACVGHDGIMTCAALFTDNHIHTAWRSGSSWSSWSDTGLAATSGPSISTLGSNRLDIFARGPYGSLPADQDNLVHVWSTNNGAAWTSVENLNGDLLGAPACIGRNPYTNTQGNRTGDLDCFARGPGSSVWQRTFNPTSNTWGSWTDRGGVLASDLAVESRAPQLLDVYAAGQDGALWELYSSDGGGTWNGWTSLGDNSGWGSWSDAPWNLNDPYHRACQYNLKLGDNPWCPVNGEFWPCASNPEIVPYLNHTLHEVGHALGLAHEQARADANVTGCGTGYGGSVTAGYITPYDRYSVMHYMYPSCGINGNYDYTGLSTYDKVAVHILYPPAGYPAEISGNLKIQQGQALSLTSAWKDWGATMSFVANNYAWKVDNVVRSTTPDLTLSGLAVGPHSVTFDYDDFLGRHHSGSWTVEVLTAQSYTNSVVASSAIAPLVQPVFTTDLPVILH